MASERPSTVEPPAGLPKALEQGLQRQDDETVVDIISYTKQLIDHLKQPPDELADEDEELVAADDGSENWTRVVKRIPCGKNCNGCPHGPYLYLVRRVSVDRLEWRYVGRVADEGGSDEEYPDADDALDATDDEDEDEDEGVTTAAPNEDVTDAVYPDQPDDEDEDEGGDDEG